MYFKKGKKFHPYFIQKLPTAYKLHYNIRNFFLNVVPIFRWKFQPKLQQLRKLQR